MPVAYDLESLLTGILDGSKLLLGVETEMLAAMVDVGEGAVLGYEDITFTINSAESIAATLDGCIMLRLREYGTVCLPGDVDDI